MIGGQDTAARPITIAQILTQCHECEMTAFISMLYKWRNWRLTQSISKSVGGAGDKELKVYITHVKDRPSVCCLLPVPRS